LVRLNSKIEDTNEAHLDEVQCWKEKLASKQADVDNAMRNTAKVEKEYQKVSNSNTTTTTSSTSSSI